MKVVALAASCELDMIRKKEKFHDIIGHNTQAMITWTTTLMPCYPVISL